MTRPMKTNDAYAYLAYRKAIIQYTINHLMIDVLGVNGTEPKQKIFSDQVFRSDSEVPHDEIQQYVEELQEREAQLNLEMGKFEFKKVDDAEKQETPKSGGDSKKAGGKASSQS
jgi:predicted mannosyl-3-phosphoglycerate phosphatase (HAD superfamily)